MIKVEAFTTSQFNAIENGAMPPKPFPFPLGVGVDLCQTKRIFSLLKVNQNIHAFSKKVFNRLEWPDVFEKFNHAALDIDNDGGIEPATGLILPDVSRWIPTSSRDFPRTHRLGTYLSGRWAAKEAAIKAHRYRKLHMKEISIIGPDTDDEDAARGSHKTHVLIDPPTRMITMTAKIAALRGLRKLEFGSQSTSSLDKMLEGESSTGDGHNPIRETSLPDHLDGSDESKLYYRRELVKDDQRQLAELNISHDGGYAVAVCLALDQKGQDVDEQTELIVDDGSGEPIHEPAWGDRGFL